MSELVVTENNFESEVLKSEKPVLLDFWATWCGPCRMLAPVMAQMAEEHPEIKVGKVNVDEQPMLANAFGVESIPMVVLMKDGKAVRATVGYQPKEQIEELLK
ncbi:MAG: thioredoxin [Spirochaetales bacterium]|nr:thioredoxin [Candidatus Physcosoma equi]